MGMLPACAVEAADEIAVVVDTADCICICSAEAYVRVQIRG